MPVPCYKKENLILGGFLIMKNLKFVKGYSMEELKAIYDEAVKSTEERWYGSNGDGISRYEQSEKFGGLISMICVNEDGEIFHYYDLPWSFETSLPAEVYKSHNIHLIENSCVPFYVGKYRDDFETEEEFEQYFEEYAVDYITELEFISFEEFVDNL